jgi:hypothetical protein
VRGWEDVLRRLTAPDARQIGSKYPIGLTAPDSHQRGAKRGRRRGGGGGPIVRRTRRGDDGGQSAAALGRDRGCDVCCRWASGARCASRLISHKVCRTEQTSRTVFACLLKKCPSRPLAKS